MTAFQLPLKPKARVFTAQLAGVGYRLTWRFNSEAACWMLSIADESGAPLVSSIPVVTGRDLLAQHRHVGIAGSLVVQTDNDPDVVPTFANLGTEGRVYFVPRS